MKYYSYKNNIEVNIYGESHATSVGVRIKGIPMGFKINENFLKKFMKRRSPSNNISSTDRKEDDEFIFVSGIKNGVVIGDEVVIDIPNKDVHSNDYSNIKHIPRPGHADLAAYLKYGSSYNATGGGAFSGRMTAPLCVAGAIFMQLLLDMNTKISAHLLSIGGKRDLSFDLMHPQDVKNIDGLYLLDEGIANEMLNEIENAKNKCDSIGGVVECAVTGFPCGIGNALFEGLESYLSFALFAIPGVKGVEFGSGFKSAESFGSINNDAYRIKDGEVFFLSNNCGGILGGISVGTPIVFRVAFKPTPSIALTQKSVNLESKENVDISINGRHDVCIAIRAVPVVEAVAAIVLYDKLLEADSWE